jgi:predicted RNase H-like HicB family nuclease
MAASTTIRNGSVQHWVVARPEPLGQFTAQVVGLPELAATAATREEAIEQVRGLIREWVATGRLVSVEVPITNPLLGFTGFIDPNHPLEQEFMENLARYRREDLERTLREDDEACSSSSSTPIT